MTAKMAYDLAYDYDLQYGFCPQCVIAALQDVLEDIPDDLIKSAQPLSGGGCLTGVGTCGALMGGLLVIGHYQGRTREQFGKAKQLKCLMTGKELVEKFMEKYGNDITCKGLQTSFCGRSFNNWNQDDAQAFKESPCKKCCAELTGDVAKWVIELLS